MRKNWKSMVIVVACLTLAFVSQAHAEEIRSLSSGHAQSNATPSNPGNGAYLSELHLDGSGLVVQSLSIFNSDGTVITTDTTDFGLGGTTPGLDSPSLGSWRQTGPFEVTQRTLYFSYDDSGNHIGTVVNTVISQGDHNFENYAGTFSAEFFLPHQDPLQDTSLFPPTTGTFTSRKIKVP